MNAHRPSFDFIPNVPIGYYIVYTLDGSSLFGVFYFNFYFFLFKNNTKIFVITSTIYWSFVSMFFFLILLLTTILLAEVKLQQTHWNNEMKVLLGLSSNMSNREFDNWNNENAIFTKNLYRKFYKNDMTMIFR